jgi:hypothetical protein
MATVSMTKTIIEIEKHQIEVLRLLLKLLK